MTGQDVCEVYWIHLESHKDIFSEGYVGISVKGAERRFIEHKSAANSGSTLTVHNAIRKHSSDIIVDTVLIGTSAYCLDVESKLRPTPNIGWNISPGGTLTRLGMKLSDESKRKISLNNGQRGRVYTDEERLHKSIKAKELDFKHTEDMKQHLKLAALERIKADGGLQIKEAYSKSAYTNMFVNPWTKPNAILDVWEKADEIFSLYVTGMIPYRIAKTIGFSHSQIRALLSRVEAGWNPGLCPEWQNFKLNINKGINK